jgi:hypothetical protein
MKDIILKLLREGIKNLPYDERPELKAASYSSLSDPSYKADIDTITHRIARAAQIASSFKQRHPEDNYYVIPTIGDGFYQVEFRHDGKIQTKHVRASGDMEQRNGAFQPSDVGTCKAFQNIAKYCFVKAGYNGSAIGASPAEDAANKALIIFKDEILDFYKSGSYIDDKAADISKEKMTDKQAIHKQKKDLEMKIGRRVSDTEWQNYLETGQEPQKKSSNISIDPQKAAELEKRQAELQAKYAALKAKRK